MTVHQPPQPPLHSQRPPRPAPCRRPRVGAVRHTAAWLAVLALSALALPAPLPAATPAAATAAATATETAPRTKVLTAHPVIHGLATALAQGTAITVERTVPTGLAPTRLRAYLSGRGEAALLDAARSADAVIGLRSFWPDDPLYPLARRGNIRIVEIDALHPVDEALPGVALRAGGTPADQPWLSPDNLGRMADIVAADLARLAPGAKAALEANLAGLRQRLVARVGATERALARAGNVSVVLLSARLDYLVTGFNLDPVAHHLHDDKDWTPEAITALQTDLRTHDVKVVLHHRAPPDALVQAIADSGAVLHILDTRGDDPLAELDSHAQALLDAFGVTDTPAAAPAPVP